MKKLLSLFSLLIILYSLLIAQDTWIQTYDPFDELLWNVEDVIICSDGGYAINGTYVDPDTYIDWGFVLKTDCDGNMLWAKRDTVSFQTENESRAIVETDDYGVISASYLYIGGTAMIKRDTNGNRVWANLLENLYVHSMDKTFDNNIIVAGKQSVDDISLSMIAKLTENGEVIWSNYFDFENTLWSVIKSVKQSADGGYLLTGYVKSEETENDVLVIKTDANGDSLWTRIYDGYGNDDRSRKIMENSESDIFVSGFFEADNRTWYRFLIKLNSGGELIYLLNEEYSVNFYGCGRMVDTVIDNKIVGYGRIDNDILLSAYDYEGENIWNTSLPIHTPGMGDRNLQLIDNGFVLSGYSFGYDLVLVKTDSNGQVVSVDDEILPLDNYILSNYPNPFNPQTTIKFNIPYPSNVLLQIYNMKGQLVNTILSEDKESGEFSVIWDAKDNASNIYFVQIKVNNQILETKKITLIK